MQRLLLVAVFAAACTDELGAESTSAWHDATGTEDLGAAVHPAPLPPPLPQVMALDSTDWVAGTTVILTATDAIPGAKVFFVRGSDVGATCFAKLGGDCLDVSNPNILGNAFADASGSALFTVAVDPAMPVGTEIFLQAVVPAGAPYTSSVLVLDSVAVCGDGVVDGDEACDDGNTDDGDGCASDCTVEVSEDFRLFVDAAGILKKDPASNSNWDYDPFFNLFEDPDAFFTVWIDGSPEYISGVDSDTRFPAWNDQILITVPADSLLEILVYDDDTSVQGGDDYIGSVSLTGEELADLADTGPFTEAGTWGLGTLDLEVRIP